VGVESALADVHRRALAGLHVDELILPENCQHPNVVPLDQRDQRPRWIDHLTRHHSTSDHPARHRRP
jgi:hypothetical protein